MSVYHLRFVGVQKVVLHSLNGRVLPVNVASMIREFFDPTPEQQNVVLIDVATYVVGWEACSEDVELPFENILDWR